MIGRLEPDILVAILVCGMAGQDGGNVENDAGFFVCEGILRGRFVCKGVEPVMGQFWLLLCLVSPLSIVPSEANLDVVDRKSVV